jgi:hypothetical protein
MKLEWQRRGNTLMATDYPLRYRIVKRGDKWHVSMNGVAIGPAIKWLPTAIDYVETGCELSPQLTTMSHGQKAAT